MSTARRVVRHLAIPLALLILVASATLVMAEDSIRLKNGSLWKGRIVDEDAKNITLELNGGGRITVAKKDIDELLRDTEDAPPEGDGPKVAGVVRKEFSFVWRGNRRLGTRTLIVRKLESGGLLLEEDTVFTDEDGKDDVRIRLVEQVTKDLEPLEITYRETSKEDANLLRGVVRKGVLEIAVSLPGERKTSRLTLPDGVRFPLSAREYAIRERERLKVHEVVVFDPRVASFLLHRFETAGTRQEDWEGANTEVSVIRRIRGKRGAEEIWIDDRGRCLTEQVNGSEMVAILSTRNRVDAFRNGSDVKASPEEEKVRPVYFHAEAGFKLKKPSLSWTFERHSRGDRKVLTISNLTYFAYVEISVLPDVPEGGLLSTLALTMEKRFGDHAEDFEKLSDGYLSVGGEKAYQMVVASKNKGEEIRSLLVGLIHGGKTWYIASSCPKKAFAAARPEFESILSSLEFLD